MSLQQIFNFETERVEWVDLSYVLEKTDTPDLRHGQPADAFERLSAALQRFIARRNASIYEAHCAPVRADN